MSKVAEHLLKIGGSVPIKRGLMTKHTLTYAGMPNENVYSLVVTCSSGHNSLAYNLYIPKDQHELELADVRITVLNVSPHEVRLRCAK